MYICLIIGYFIGRYVLNAPYLIYDAVLRLFKKELNQLNSVSHFYDKGGYKEDDVGALKQATPITVKNDLAVNKMR